MKDETVVTMSRWDWERAVALMWEGYWRLGSPDNGGVLIRRLERRAKKLTLPWLKKKLKELS